MNDPTLFDILAVSPQLSEKQRAGWSYAGFKGGSEPGVLNLTWLLKDEAGQWHMLAASWLNPEEAVENAALGLLAVRILALRYRTRPSCSGPPAPLTGHSDAFRRKDQT